MSFATAEDVMNTVEQLVIDVVHRLSQDIKFRLQNDKLVPVLAGALSSSSQVLYHSFITASFANY